MIYTVLVYKEDDENSINFKFFTLGNAIDKLMSFAAHGEVHMELCVSLCDERTEVIYKYWKNHYIPG